MTNFRLNFSRCTDRDVAPLVITTVRCDKKIYKLYAGNHIKIHSFAEHCKFNYARLSYNSKTIF